MFEPSQFARVFGAPLGVDFPATFVEGFLENTRNMPPEDIARIRVLVNTRRMQRRIRDLFISSGALLLPRLGLVTDFSVEAIQLGFPTAVSPLRRRLELVQLVSDLLDRQPDLAPKTAAFDLANSLAALMEEMQGEGVNPEVLHKLDVTDESGHWQRALTVIQLVDTFFGADTEAPDREGLNRHIAETLAANWTISPPTDPILIVGSTGSRGTTALLMEAVARLPQGAVILPGYDFDMSASIWSQLEESSTSEDHPQYRFSRLCSALDIAPKEVPAWTATTPFSADRNRLVSTSLCPAPVTNTWLDASEDFNDLPAATKDVTLVEAASPRLEATAIALRLRQAAEDGQKAALITPDRMLSRRVASALDRWGILPDDSAGMPLPLSAPGRLLMELANLTADPIPADVLITILKHPLVNTGSDERGTHLRHTRELELGLRRNGPAFPQPDDLLSWADESDDRTPWVRWLGATLFAHSPLKKDSVAMHIKQLLTLAEALSQGPVGEGTGTLWEDTAGREAERVLSELIQEADAAGAVTRIDFLSILRGVLNSGEVREFDAPHPNILIWGTLEARVQGADLVILGGLNEGTWPEAATPDPWLNRKMRQSAGLLLPDRQIGLAAHDYQQAVAAKEVWLSRSIRNDEAETIPSRWVNRLTNLMGGLTKGGGPDALKAMRKRSEVWLDWAQMLDAPAEVVPEKRPSPVTPLSARPRQLSVTAVKTLIRDPYAIYARYILGLKRLDPLSRQPDAALRGTILHDALERFIKDGSVVDHDQGVEALLEAARSVLETEVPWPATQKFWLGRLRRVADFFVEREMTRQADQTLVGTELDGSISLTGLDFKLTGKADRIDLKADGTAVIYDYKTGAAPSKDQQLAFDKQLLLEAVMAEMGAFSTLGAVPVSAATFISLTPSTPKESAAPIDESKVWADFIKLISRYFEPDQGYTARRALLSKSDFSDYDLLSRFGEWDTTDAAQKIIVGDVENA